MNIAEFRKRFATTSRREHLVDLLEAELRTVDGQGWAFRALVYGSVVTSEKSEPGDIDMLLSIAQPFGAPLWRKLDQTGDVQIKGDRRTASFDPDNPASMTTLPACHTPVELVQLFNESADNVRKGIAIDVADCVEVQL